MKGNPDVIKVLNEVLRKELTGINQYFVHSKMCKNWGYEVLAGVHWKESIDEMKHADSLVELKPGIKTCLDAQDDASRELLEHIVVDEEHHIDWIESQFHQIKEVGYENYLAQQIFKKG
jgi:bacterioferritin